MNLHYLPLAKPDESPTSMIRRTAIHNGYPSCAVFLNHFLHRTSYNSLLFQEGKLARKLADLAFPFEQELLKGFYQVNLDDKDQSRIILLHDIMIPNALLRYAEAAICTDCWQEEFESRIKDLRSSLYCPRHNKQYLSCCLACSRPFTWYNQITMKCVCGAQLKSPTASSMDVYPETLVANLLKSRSQEKIDLFSQTLLSMDFYATKHRTDFTRNRNIVKAAIGLACGELELCAESLATLAGGSSALGNAMLLAKLPTLTCINDISNILADKPETCSHVNAETLTTEQVKKLVNATAAQWNRIQAHPQFPKNSRTRPRYHDSDIRKIMEISKDFSFSPPKPNTQAHSLISFRECFAKLNMPKANFSNLCKQGFFGPSIQLGKATQHFFSMDKFEKFHHEYISVWQLAEDYDLTVRTIRKIVSQSNLTTIKTDRHVASVFPAPSFIKRIDIGIFNQHKDDSEPDSEATPQTLLATCPTLPPTMSALVLSSHDAALRLGTHRVYIYALIHQGLLDAYGKGRQLYVTAESFERLKREYITGHELEKLLDIHSACIPRALAHHGMLNLAIALPYNQLQYIYRRKDFTADRIITLNPPDSDYGRAHREKRLIKISKICQELGIYSHQFHKFTDCVFNARPEHYRTAAFRLDLSESEANSIRRRVSKLVPISTLSIDHGIPPTEIECRFIRNHAITSYIIHKQHFVTKAHYRILDKFYASNFTLKQSQTLTGLPGGYLQSLLYKKVIKACNVPLGGCSTPTMFSIKTLRRAVSRYKSTGSKLLHLKLAHI